MFTAAEIVRMIFQTVIELTTTELAVTVRVFTKKDDLLRFSVDYGKLYAINICESYPLFRTDEVNNSLREATETLTLDANSRN